MALHELGVLISQGMTEEQFQTTRTFLRDYVKLYIQTPSDRLGYLMDSRLYGRKDYISDLGVGLAALTREDVNRAIKKYLESRKDVCHHCDRHIRGGAACEEFAGKPAIADELLQRGKGRAGRGREGEGRRGGKLPLKVTSVRIVNSKDTFR